MDPRLNPAGAAAPADAGRLLPIDRVVVVWNVLLCAAWLAAAGRESSAAVWAILHAAAAWLLPAWLRGGGRRRGGMAGALRDAYPWLVWVVAWSELGRLHAVSQAATRDPLIARLDLALFGGPLHRTWALAASGRWLQEAAHFAYLSYFVLIVVVPLRAVLRQRRDEFRAATLGMVATYLGCFAVSAALPVCGPRLAEGAGAGHGLFASLAAALRAAGDSPGTAFPSSHCAASVMSACLAWRAGSRRLAPWLAGWAAAVVLSTVYTGNHYALDAAAGAAWALLLNAALGPRRALAPRRRTIAGRRATAIAGGERAWPSRS